MSREIRRVPLDFDFPLGETWTGYLRPDDLRLPQCPDCYGCGATAAHEWVGSLAGLLLMVGEDAARQADTGRDLHPYLANLENRPYHFVDKSRVPVLPRPSADAVDLSTGLAGRAAGPFGHDAIDRWNATAAIIKAAGLPEGWGTCTTCAGEGQVATPEQMAAHEAWEPTEGGPVSPVFAAPEELADWIIASKPLHGSTTPRDALIRWIAAEGSSVGSFAMTGDGQQLSGVELAAGAS